MGHPEHETIDTTGLPVQQEENRQAFLRYLPRRIADFERRILRYRFHGWDPNGMMVLAGDARRLADASSNYSLAETREHLMALAQMVGGHAASLRGPDLKQAERMFALLSAVLRSLPSMQPPPSAAVEAPTMAVDVRHDTAGKAQPEAATADAPTAADIPAPEVVESAPMTVESAATESVAAAAQSATNDAATEDVEAMAPDGTAAGTPVPASAFATQGDGFQQDATTESTVSQAAVEESTPASQEDRAEPETSPASGTSGEPLPADVAADAAIASIGDVVIEPAPSIDSPQTVEAALADGTVDPPDAAVPAATGAQAAQDTPQPSPDAAPSPESVAYDDGENPETVGAIGLRRIFHLCDGNAFTTELEQRLESEGFAVEPVESVEELSELLTCMMPHMLLVDPSQVSRLPIVAALRRDTQQQTQPPRHIQLIVMTPQDSLDVRRAAHRAGADLMLFPPFEVADVSDRLKALNAAAAADPVRVLVVDDERADALFAQTVLNRAGMRARVENDPMRVLEALRSERTDLVLMDLHMPFANGVEVTMLIREDPQLARIPIVFLSGESDPDSRLEAINAGGDDFLFKPIRPRHLIAAVQDRVRRLHAVDRQAAVAGDAPVA